jgi:hypothetical protein
MKTISFFFVFVALAAVSAHATLLLYEPFDYPNIGGPVTDNTPGNWTFGGSGANDNTVVSGSLSAPGLAPSVGNSIVTGGAGLGVRRLFGTTVTSDTLYFSALFDMNSIGTGWTTANASVGALTETNNTGFKVSVVVNRDGGNGYRFGVQKGGTGTTVTSDSTSYLEGNVVFLVGSYDFNPDPDTVSLWINPSPETFALQAPPLATLIATSGTDSIAGLDRFNFRQNVATGANSVPEAMQWDELRVGDTWADVTPIPEPSNLAFFLLTAGSVMSLRRSHRH